MSRLVNQHRLKPVPQVRLIPALMGLTCGTGFSLWFNLSGTPSNDSN